MDDGDNLASTNPLSGERTDVLHKIRDRLADASIFFSFDRTGYERHARRFDPADEDITLEGKRILVTGANSGLGRAAAFALAHRRAEVWLLCRSEERGQQALDDLRLSSQNENLRLELIDVSSMASVRAFAERLGDQPVDVLINNAGVLPAERQLTDEGLELTWATNVVGPFLLGWLLTPNLVAAARASAEARASAGEPGEARIINVTSGGMYTQRLDLRDVDWQQRTEKGEDFDGVVAYAQTKRAEVILTEMLADRLAGTGVTVNSMHPGWADTPAVREALPRFWRLTRNRLRTPRQGADTMAWLASSSKVRGISGKLFFDRRPVPTHLLPKTPLLPKTRERPRDRAALWELCCRQAGVEGSPLDSRTPPRSSEPSRNSE